MPALIERSVHATDSHRHGVRSQELVGRVLLERADDGEEEVDDVLVLLVPGSVARDVKGAGARRVLAELVRPEAGVGLALADPVLLHVREQVDAAELQDDLVERRAVVRGDALGRRGVVLAREVAVRGVRAVAVVRPEAVDRPGRGQIM
jgi:hypothetical protein